MHADNQARLLARFATVIARAVAHAAKVCDIDAEDLRSHAMVRVLLYGRGEAWSKTPHLSAHAPAGIDRMVQRSLNDDLIDYMRQDSRERGGRGGLALESVADTPAEPSYVMPDIAEDDDRQAEAGNARVTAYLDEHFPLLMQALDGGMSEREIARNAGMTKGAVQYAIAHERGQFMRAMHNGTIERVRAGDFLCVTSAPHAA